jgi:hypothetical protein
MCKCVDAGGVQMCGLPMCKYFVAQGVAVFVAGVAPVAVRQPVKKPASFYASKIPLQLKNLHICTSEICTSIICTSTKCPYLIFLHLLI